MMIEEVKATQGPPPKGPIEFKIRGNAKYIQTTTHIDECGIITVSISMTEEFVRILNESMSRLEGIEETQNPKGCGPVGTS